jgi:DNA polymerase I-like protein with 3'-5' exonuclease and polymerase domains/5'-3' exonuclease
MRVVFDCASFLWTALQAGKDGENGREVQHGDKTVYVNSALYGYEKALGPMLQVLEAAKAVPTECILVFEGMHSKKLRQAIEPTYKANRDNERPPEAYVEYEAAIKMLERAWLDVGAIVMRQPFVEGDDVLAYVATNSHEDVMVATYDNDLIALVGRNAYGADINVWVNGRINDNKFGPFPFKHVTLYKALVGDSNDNIKGCPGFGPKSWEAFYLGYGDEGLEVLQNALESGSLGDIHAQREEDKLIRLICDKEAETLRSYRLAKLHPEWVNTRQRVLEIKPGMVRVAHEGTDERLRKWCQQPVLVTAANWDQVAAFCRQQYKQSPFVALDIETSTPPESDEWLVNKMPSDPNGVDVLGSELTGLSMTFGRNLQHTVYISVDHKDTANITSEAVRQLVADIPSKQIATVIQNLSFELTVLYQAWGEKQEDNGAHGFLPNCLDTKMEASYVDENIKNGLKLRSKTHLGYTQQSYDETTQFSGPEGTLPPGGRQIKLFDKVVEPKHYWFQGAEVSETDAMTLDQQGQTVEFDEEVTQPWETRQYKMNELTAEHVFGYGCDDTICTAALHNYYKLVMELEHTWDVYKQVEIDAAYMSAAGFLQGTDFSVQRMRELEEIDKKTYTESWAVVREFLMANGWDGTICPTFSATSKPSELKDAFLIVTGKPLETQVRKVDKLAKLMEAEGAEVLAQLLLDADKNGDWATFNSYVQKHFKGEPQFNNGSPKQKQRLLYEVMKLPVALRNKPTDTMREKGITEGSPTTDVLAIDWAIKFDAAPEQKKVLEALKLMQMVDTRTDLYYRKYPPLLHWKTGKLHSSLNQCEANTRRSSESDPNKQQLPKHQKIEGQPARFRETIVPHHADAVIVSLDESSQELRIIADYSQDPNMVACYVGENKMDMHSLTGLGIAKWKFPNPEWSYPVFMAAYKDHSHPLHAAAKECRPLGKKVNFTTEYGAMAKRVSETLTIPEAEAQVFCDAKDVAFPVAKAWKGAVIAEARANGLVRTKAGAIRHLRDALNSMDGYIASKAERQSVNFEVQGSAAEQTKLAYGRAWRMELIFKYDCVFIGPIHDEVVWSVAISDLPGFLRDMHACMVQPYGGMTIPIESSISFGPSFGEQYEAGEDPAGKGVFDALGVVAAEHPRYAASAEAVATAEGQQAVYRKAWLEAKEAIEKAKAHAEPATA